MDYSEYKYLVQSDLYRITGVKTRASLLRGVLFGKSFKYIFWMRTCRYTRENRLLRNSIYPIARLMLSRCMYRFGISVPFTAEIGSGFYIGHFGGIVVSPYCRIGKNCNLSQGVTIGEGERKGKRGCPVLGDNVFVGPGAMIFGSVSVGNKVVIGANSVVVKDLPDNAVAVGVPARIISLKGSGRYINRTDYEEPSPAPRSPAPDR